MDMKPYRLNIVIVALISLAGCADQKNPEVKVTPVYYTGEHNAYEQAAKMISPNK